MKAKRVSHAVDACPMCKSMQLEELHRTTIANGEVREHLRCMNCCADIVQVYGYKYTVGEWEEYGEEGD